MERGERGPRPDASTRSAQDEDNGNGSGNPDHVPAFLKD